jgi:hypothetical protein
MKMFNACVVLVSSCLTLFGVLGAASVRLGSAIEHPFDEMYEGSHKDPPRLSELNRAA